MNVVFISPHFPRHFYQFCARLKERGVTVLGIGDAPFDAIGENCQNSLSDYRYVSSLQDYDQVYRAVADYVFSYGRIDFVESENEYWLELDAKIRTDFNIATGPKFEAMAAMNRKSRMKEAYARAKIPTARWTLPQTQKEASDFAHEVGYPVIVKPDKGVGASNTYKLKNDAELAEFWTSKPADVPYIEEELVPGHVETFDGVVDAKGDIRFCASQIYHQSLMDTVLNDECITYHSEKKIKPDIEKAGRAIVKAYGIKDTFFHFEFFRTVDAAGKDKVVALEVNMRPPGGMITDIYEASHDVNVYKLWADVLITGETGGQDTTQKRFAGFASRKNRFSYRYSLDEILEKYGDHIMEHEPVYGITARAMGDHYFLIYADTKKELLHIIDEIDARR